LATTLGTRLIVSICFLLLILFSLYYLLLSWFFVLFLSVSMTEWFVSQPGGSDQSDISQSLFTVAVNTAEEQAPEQVLLYWILIRLYDQEFGVLNDLQQVD
jgi:hypothetical protein